MPANLFAERFGIRPATAFGMSVGGATGLAMLAQAARLVSSGAARHVLVVAGEDRASGQTREASTRVARPGRARGATRCRSAEPSRPTTRCSPRATCGPTACEPESLAAFPVQMRAHAARKLGAQFQKEITVEDVLASRPVAEPLRLLDCCPVSDGGAAFVVSAGAHRRPLARDRRHRPGAPPPAPLGHGARRVRGAASAAQRALAEAEVSWEAVDVYGIYDSFSITVAMLLEELGLTPPGRAGAYARAGAFEVDGRYPMNTHGGLLSYGHCGVGGGMAHLAEVATQLRHERGAEPGRRRRGRLRARRRRRAVRPRRRRAAKEDLMERLRDDWTAERAGPAGDRVRPLRQPLVPPARALPGLRVRRGHRRSRAPAAGCASPSPGCTSRPGDEDGPVRLGARRARRGAGGHGPGRTTTR